MEYPMYTVPLETLLTLTHFRSHEAKLILWTWNDGWAETILTSWCILIIHEWMVNVYVNIIVSSWKYDSEHIPKWQVWSGSIFLSQWVVITTGAQESIDDGILIEFHPGTGERQSCGFSYGLKQQHDHNQREYSHEEFMIDFYVTEFMCKRNLSVECCGVCHFDMRAYTITFVHDCKIWFQVTSVTSGKCRKMELHEVDKTFHNMTIFQVRWSNIRHHICQLKSF